MLGRFLGRCFDAWARYRADADWRQKLRELSMRVDAIEERQARMLHTQRWTRPKVYQGRTATIHPIFED